MYRVTAFESMMVALTACYVARFATLPFNFIVFAAAAWICDDVLMMMWLYFRNTRFR